MEEAFRRAHRESFRNPPPTPAARYERRNAPIGFDYGDKKYRRGQFIPGTVLFQHTPKHAAVGRWRPVAPDAQPATYDDRDENPFDVASWRRETRPPDPEPGLPRPDVQPAISSSEPPLFAGDDPDDLGGIVDLRDVQPAIAPHENSADARVGGHVRDMFEMAAWSDPAYAENYFQQLPPEMQDRVRDFMTGQLPPEVQPANVPAPALDTSFANQVHRLAGLAGRPDFGEAVFDYLGMIGPDKRGRLAAMLQVPDTPGAIADALEEGRAAGLNPEPDTPERVSPEKHALSRTPVTEERNLAEGKNGAVLLKFADREGSYGVFKSPRDERPLRETIRPGTYYLREVAASSVADLLGMHDLVPPTTFRDHNGRRGSIQRYVADAEPAFEIDPLSRHDGPEDAARAAVFDYVIGNSDRHLNNWLLGEQSDPDSTGKLVLIDNGISFPTRHRRDDWFVYGFWDDAVEKNLPMPDLAPMRGKWPYIERALLDAGIEPPAVALTRERYEEATSGRHRYVGDLPVFWRGQGRINLRKLLTRL